MVSVAVSAEGKTGILFIERGVKINSQSYCDDVLAQMLPEIEDKMLDYTFMRDGAPAHRAQKTLEYLRSNCADFIEPNLWPPSSPDLNPVDYFIWSALEEKVYRRQQIRTIAQLKERIVKCWKELPQDAIRGAIMKWRSRLKEVVSRGGGHIEPYVCG